MVFFIFLRIPVISSHENSRSVAYWSFVERIQSLNDLPFRLRGWDGETIDRNNKRPTEKRTPLRYNRIGFAASHVSRGFPSISFLSLV